MRNMIVQTLPAGATLLIDIVPPMTDEERPILVPLRGRGTVVVHVIDSTHLEINNVTGEIAPFILIIAKTPNVPPEIQRLMATLIATLRNH